MKYIIYFLVSILPLSAFATYPNKVIQVYPQQVIQRHTVEFDADTYLGLQGYYGTTDKLKLEQLRANDIDKETIKNLIIILANLAKQQNGQPVPQVQPEKEQVVAPNLDRLVYEIFTKNCTKCHGDLSSELKLTTKDGLYDLSYADRALVYLRVSGDVPDLGLIRMPKGGQSLSEKDLTVLRTWALKKKSEK